MNMSISYSVAESEKSGTHKAVEPFGSRAFGWPNVFSPSEAGLAIEDVWPSLYIGADRVEEMARKVRTLEWAKQALTRWQSEAESVLREPPAFMQGKPGGRCSMHTNDGTHLVFNPADPSKFYDPRKKQFVEPNEAMRAASVTLSHERVRRLMSSLAFLWRLTGDERYSQWVWDGLRRSVELYASADYGQKFGRVYDGLYEAQSMMQLIQALQLVEGAPGTTESDHQAVIDTILQPVGEKLSSWMDAMIVHNMSCWSMAALALLGRYLGRNDWVNKAFHSERCGLTALLTRGLPIDENTGQPDGFWFEGSVFYGCFYVTTPIIPLYRQAEEADVIDDKLRTRFESMFVAPLHFADSRLRLLSIADRVGPGVLQLTQMRHLYEYAAGQVDPTYGPLLNLLNKRCGASRDNLAALAWGPDELPPSQTPDRLQHSCVLPAYRVVTFRHNDTTLWFNASQDCGGGDGHHHMDKLSLSLHAEGEIVSSDLGWPGREEDKTRGQYLNGTLSHNTLQLDEFDQGCMKNVSFDVDLKAPVPWARATVRGTSELKNLWKVFRDHHGGRLQEGLYDHATLTRTVFFDYPYIVLLDEMDAECARRFSFAFHARGDMVVKTQEAADSSSLAMQPLPDDGAWSHFRGRTSADPIEMLVADWRIHADLMLRLVAVSDDPFEATWGHTPDNPADILRGTVYLRAPGEQRIFATVLEVHSGTPTVQAVTLQDKGQVTVDRIDGSHIAYGFNGVE